MAGILLALTALTGCTPDLPAARTVGLPADVVAGPPPSSLAGPDRGVIRWQRRLEGSVVIGPIVAPDGTIYAGTEAGILHSIDPATGADHWAFDGGGRFSPGGPSSPALTPSGHVVFAGPAQSLFVLSPDGTLLWREQLSGTGFTPLVVVRPDPTGSPITRIYVTDVHANLSAFEVGAGAAHSRRWQQSLGLQAHSGPIIGADGTIAQAVDDNVVTMRDTGDSLRISWRFHTGETIPVAPVYGAGQILIVSSNDPYLYAVDPDGERRWRIRRGPLATAPPTVTADSLVYDGDRRGGVNVVDARRGRLVARYQTLAPTRLKPSVAVSTASIVDRERRVYFGTLAGHVLGLAPDGTVRFDLDLGSPVTAAVTLTASGGLVVGAEDGSLSLLD